MAVTASFIISSLLHYQEFQWFHTSCCFCLWSCDLRHLFTIYIFTVYYFLLSQCWWYILVCLPSLWPDSDSSWIFFYFSRPINSICVAVIVIVSFLQVPVCWNTCIGKYCFDTSILTVSEGTTSMMSVNEPMVLLSATVQTHTHTACTQQPVQCVNVVLLMSRLVPFSCT